jgi:hypothetical protein
MAHKKLLLIRLSNPSLLRRNQNLKTVITLGAILIILAVGTVAVFGQVTVIENYVDVQIESFTVDRTRVDAGSSATATVKLKNSSNFTGGVTQGFSTPSEVVGSCSITGGGGVNFAANEQKAVDLQIKNAGNLASDVTTTFTYTVTNENGDVTAQKTLQLTFIHGLGPHTTLTITAIDGSTQQVIPAALIQCTYGVNNEDIQTGSTSNNDGSITFDLGTYTGQVQVTASAAGRFQNQTQTVTANEGANTATFYMTPELGISTTTQNNQTNWVLYGAIAIVVAVMIVGVLAAYSVRKKKNKPPTSQKCLNAIGETS